MDHLLGISILMASRDNSKFDILVLKIFSLKRKKIKLNQNIQNAGILKT